MVSTIPMHIGRGSLLAARVIQPKRGPPLPLHAQKSKKIVEQQPDFAAALSLLGMIDAGLDKKKRR